MATSGTLNTSKYSIRCVTLTWSVKSQDIAKNTTTINWALKGGGDEGSWYASRKFKFTIDGKQVYYSSSDIQLRKGTSIASGTYTINHNMDGTKNFTAYVEAAIYTFAVNCKGTSTFTLPTIPRASKHTVTGTFNLGGTIIINTNRASSSLTHTLKYTFGSRTGTIASNVGASSSWVIPKTLASAIPNGTSGTLVITCETYSGSTRIGTNTTSHTITVPNTAEFNPTISTFTLVEAIADINSTFGALIQSKSKLLVKATANGAYSSTIKSYSITVNGATYTSNSFTTNFLSNSGSQNAVLKVTDSRGRSVSRTLTYNVLAYVVPKINSFSVNRCDSDGTDNDEGVNAKVTINSSITPLNNKNSKNFKLLYKKQSDSDWTTIVLSNTNYILNASGIIGNIDADYEYDFRVEVIDYFTTTQKTIPLSSAFTLMDFNRSGKGMAIGKVSKKDALEINMDIYDKYGTNINNGLASHSENGLDANTTIEELALCNKNIPYSSGYAYVRTLFYLDKTITSNRTQISYPFTSGQVYIRQYIDNEWTQWRLIG